MASPVVFDDAAPWGQRRPTGLARWLICACHAIPAGFKAGYRLVLLLRRPVKYGAGGPLDVQAWGLRLRLMPRGNIAEAKLLFSPQFFDPAEREWLMGRLAPGAVFLDVGANIGAYSLWVRSRLGDSVRILSVEPDPELRRRLDFNLATNGVRNVELCPVALSDFQGHADLQTRESQRGENRLVQDSGASGGGALLRVTVDTLPDLLRARGVTRVDALKIDIEGHELKVLAHFFANAAEAIWPRAILIELKPDTEPALHALLLDRGYRLEGRTKLNGFYGRPG